MKAQSFRSRWLATAVVAAGLGGALGVEMAPPAQRFVTVYRALGKSAEPLSAWERVTFSYLLARGGSGREKQRADLGVRPQ